MTRVVILENHDLVRRALETLVNAESDMVTCGATACTESAFALVADARPDVVIVDVAVTRGAGLHLIQKIRGEFPAVRIVALAVNERPELSEQVFTAGAAALVVKSELAARLLGAIRRGQGIGPVSAPTEDEAVAAGASDDMIERRLAPLERQILELIGRGIPTRAIAIRLGISVATAEACRRELRHKLNFPSAAQLVEFCVQWVERVGRAPEANDVF